MSRASEIKQILQKKANPKKAALYQRFFKTGKGEYGEGDLFLGITVPELRKIAKQYSDLSLAQIQLLLQSTIHEHRLIALYILVAQFEKATKEHDEKKQKQIVDFYVDNTTYINNWDLVDTSAHKILGVYYLHRSRKQLFVFVRSKNLWERRIAVIATFLFIQQNDFDDALKIAALLLTDNHDLIHKAVGWMLREIGKRNQQIEENFLKKHASQMPRTMLRYAIEKLPEKKRKTYLKK